MTAIGIFDSGYGGLTVFKSIRARLPQYDYIYLGDNARAPYGNRSFETVYEYTLECVEWFLEQKCPLTILACNTASAKALRSIQRHLLPDIAPDSRVLGVIRPTSEVIGEFTRTGNIGILGTTGTVTSQSYPMEIQKFFPDVKVFQQACPMLVPLIESNEYLNNGADYFVEKYLRELLVQSPDIDTVLLACTHYPILEDTFKKFLPAHIRLVTQGNIVAESLAAYLSRHPEIESRLTRNGKTTFYTTDDVQDFEHHAQVFLEESIQARHLRVDM